MYVEFPRADANLRGPTKKVKRHTAISPWLRCYIIPRTRNENLPDFMYCTGNAQKEVCNFTFWYAQYVFANVSYQEW